MFICIAFFLEGKVLSIYIYFFHILYFPIFWNLGRNQRGITMARNGR